MAYVPVINAVQVEYRMLFNTQRVENTQYFYNAAGASPTAVADLLAGLSGWWVTEFAPLVADDLVLQEIYGTVLNTATSPTYSNVDDAGETGDSATAPLPGNVAAVVSFKTDQRGRSGRGRNYIPAIPSSVVVSNFLTSGYQTSVVTAYNTLRGNTYVPLGWQWVVVSRFTAGAPRVTGIVIPVTTAAIATPYVGTQRKRLFE